MEKINVKQLQDIEINGEKLSITEAFEEVGTFAETISSAVNDLSESVGDIGSDVEDKVSNERLDEFIDDGGTAISLETWAGNVETFAGQVTQGMDDMGATIQSLPQTYATKAQLADYVANQRLDEFEPNDGGEEGTVERWAGGINWQIDDLDGNKLSRPVSANSGDVLTYNGSAWVAQAPSGGGGLPAVTSADDGYYFRVDSNGDVIKYPPADSIGDGDFSSGYRDSFATAEAIEELIYQHDDFITGGYEVTDGCLGVKVQEIKERLQDFIDYEIVMGDPIHFTSDPNDHNLIYGTYTITGVNRVDVIRLKENYTGAFDDLIGITFLNLDDYPSWSPEGADLHMTILNAERTEWEVEYGDTYGGRVPTAWDIELIPYEVRKRIPNSNDSGYQILEEFHREDW